MPSLSFLILPVATSPGRSCCVTDSSAQPIVRIVPGFLGTVGWSVVQRLFAFRFESAEHLGQRRIECRLVLNVSRCAPRQARCAGPGPPPSVAVRRAPRFDIAELARLPPSASFAGSGNRESSDVISCREPRTLPRAFARGLPGQKPPKLLNR